MLNMFFEKQKSSFLCHPAILYVAHSNSNMLVAVTTHEVYDALTHTSGVPQNVDVVPLVSMFSLHRPKSVRMMWPCESSRMFSGLRSRYTILSECR